jgi:hypothetical protein
LQFYPPFSNDAPASAIRVTFSQMPGPSDCVGIPDYSAFQGDSMWVGAPDPNTGVSRLQATPLHRVWDCATLEPIPKPVLAAG